MEEIEQAAPRDGAYCYGFYIRRCKMGLVIGKIRRFKTKRNV